ncbi:MAG: type II toxin-antitoxin system VapC family toxin [Candidatus Delongbacteria bacterium]|nr:type II toxin-antitoxin system VapC family toxin [Candidatus Delongbacteria bacterium]
MNLSIDTHAFLWYITGDKQLPDKIVQIIGDTSNRCFISIASIWEIVIKLSLDKLEIKGGFATIEDFLLNNDFEILPIDFDDTRRLLALEYHHRDPFDRMIIAQAQTTNSVVVSKDKLFKNYDIKLLW